MRYILLVLLSLSLPALAVDVSPHNDANHSSKRLQIKIQQNAKELCDPAKELHMIPFN